MKQKLTANQIADALMSPLGFAKVMRPEWLENWHQHKINDALERVFIGDCKRLVINVPPRSGKTELSVKMFIAWATGHYPDSEWIHASYSKRLASRNTYETRAFMQHEYFAQIFPRCILQDDSKAKDEFRTTRGGVVYATGAGGTITGYGAGKKRSGFGGAIIIDDALNATESNSEVMRENVNEWYMTTMQSRMNSPDTPVIVIMQRLHENDLTGFLLNGGSGEKWEHICIPALGDDGKSYWEAQLPTERLLQMKSVASMVFAGQYMQTPAPAEGGIYKVAWFDKRHEWAQPYNNTFEKMVLSVDGAFTTKEQNDATAITLWGVRHNDAYLLDCHNVRLDTADVEKLIKQLYNQHNCSGVLIENKASGLVLIPALQKAGLSVIGIEPIKDKISRASSSSMACEAGRIILPKYAPWLHDVENQLFFFPNAKHDDIVDSISQFINWWQGGDDDGFKRMMEKLLNG